MKSLTFLISVVLILGCNNYNKPNTKRPVDQHDSIEKVQDVIHGTLINNMQINITTGGNVLMIKDTTQYSKTFIKDLIQLNSDNKSLVLIDDTIYYSIDGIIEYSEPLPTELPLNKLTVYESEEGKNKYILRLTRISYTNINYELTINDSVLKKGIGLLHGSFFFAAAQEEDGKEKNVISCNQYNDSLNQYSQIKVEIGSGERVVLYMDVKNYHLDRMVFRK